MIRRISIAALIVVLLGLVGFWLLSRRPEIASVERPSPESFSAELIARGETLAAEGHCASCHMGAGGPPFAGGYGVNTTFGIIYGTNITPDPKTGIGNWSYEAFERAMREGVSRDGSLLFPAFPYCGRTGNAIVHHACQGSGRCESYHHRRARSAGQASASNGVA
jgi:hypothetical protein